MPRDAVLLSIQVQRDEPKLWALVDTDTDDETRYFKVIGSGVAFNVGITDKFLGTFQMYDEALEFHVFESL